MSARDDLVAARDAAMLDAAIAAVRYGSDGTMGVRLTPNECKALLALLDAEPAAWIPVSERLPDADDRYAVMYRQGRQHKAWTLDYSVTDGWQGVMPEWIVTHWMPLPARPEASPDYGLCSECGKRLTHPHLHRCEPQEASDE